jgi:hypothetical protein
LRSGMHVLPHFSVSQEADVRGNPILKVMKFMCTRFVRLERLLSEHASRYLEISALAHR